ncbi:NADH dehydrogenase [ubiquinone] 1 beta subcomplex subunit 11, mitochondrial [Salminus brasiliensis]|uniref:NADH dehydrogenase [ubiquinone] 1 beta subcomplex subunit 11, mitochondrial n=1 Tax=Salminus brasiliensis TaxID=930266 RepID=UPI003B831A55
MAPLLRALRSGLRSGLRSVCFARAVSNSAQSQSAVVAELQQRAPVKDDHQEVNVFEQNPDYHGFSSDPFVDEWNMRLAFFFGISMVIVAGGTFLHYLPDHGMRQWTRREAEQLIKKREAEGLPLIGENYYDPSKIILPSPSDE